MTTAAVEPSHREKCPPRTSCMWCEVNLSSDGPARTFAARAWAFRMPLPNGRRSRRYWARAHQTWPACVGCTPLVERGDVEGLAMRHTLQVAAAGGDPVVALSELAALFRVIDRALVR